MKNIHAILFLLLALTVLSVSVGSAADLAVDGGTIQEFRFDAVDICPGGDLCPPDEMAGAELSDGDSVLGDKLATTPQGTSETD